MTIDDLLTKIAAKRLLDPSSASVDLDPLHAAAEIDIKMPQRWGLDTKYGGYMDPRGDGDFVRAEDVQTLLAEIERLREALEDIARGDYSDPMCERTPEQRAREALEGKQ